MNFEYFDDFWIQKLIFINSAGSANVVMPMSVMGLLLGRNNVGKTSAISALKLFILPETNFKGCKEKFGFVSNGEYHEAHESARFYFPSDRSFIICEAENPKGRFCMILHRSSEEWGYARILVPIEYNQIKHLFWDFNNQYNQGFGCNLAQLSLQKVKEGLKPFKPVFLTKSDEIKEAIYSRPRAIDDLSRYCLIPLPQKGEKREVEAIRSLLSLAFQINGADKLAGAVASIIETENAGKEGKLSVDILEINREYDELKIEGEKLRCVHVNQSTWLQLDTSYKSYVNERNQFRRNFSTLLGKELALKKDLNVKISELNGELEKILVRKNHAKQQVDSLKSKITFWNATLEEKERSLNKHQNSINLVDQYGSQYKPIVGINKLLDLAEHLNEELLGIKQDISAYEDKEQAKEQLNQLNKQRVEIEKKITSLHDEYINDIRSTLESIDSHSRSILYSLNSAFGHIKTAISKPQMQVVEQFCKLFDIEQGLLSFLDEPMKSVFYQTFNPDKVRNERDDHIKTLKDDKNKILERIKCINDIVQGKPADLQRLIDKRDEFEQVIINIGAYDHIKKEILSLKDEIKKISNEDLPLIKSALDEEEEKLEVAILEHESIDNQIKIVAAQINDLAQYSKSLHMANDNLNQSFYDDFLNQNIQPIECTDTTDVNRFLVLVNSFQDQCSTINSLKKYIFHNIKQLITEKLLPEQASIEYDLNLKFEQVIGLYENLRAIFENYEDNLIKYRNDIESHNNQTGVRAAAVWEISKLIESFKKSINLQLASFPISNLSTVEMVIDVDPRFAELRDDMDSVTFAGDQLLSESIYQRLTDFCEKFFKGVQGYGKCIQLDKVITNVRYKVAVDGVQSNSQQSTGTTGMINTVLLALLLKRMVPASVRLHFPIIFDEVLSLDSVNLKTIKHVVEDNNFVLFVVCPNNAGIVADAIPNWYDLSLHSITEGIMIQRCEVLHFGLTETLTEDREKILDNTEEIT